MTTIDDRRHALLTPDLIRPDDHAALVMHVRQMRRLGPVEARLHGWKRGFLTVQDADERPDRIDGVLFHRRRRFRRSAPGELLTSYDHLEVRDDERRAWVPVAGPRR